MPTLEIPERYLDGINKLLRLDDKSIEEIRLNLERESQSSGGSIKIGSVIARSVSDSRIAEALTSLYVVKSSREVSAEEFAEAVCAAAEREAPNGPPFPQPERTQFKDRLVKLLNVKGVGIAAKAVDLQTDDERTFCGVRILTDLRPVFGSNIADGPEGMVIVHLLKLGYHQTGIDRHVNFYVSLDSDDLKMLRKVIDRAEQKANALKATMSRLPYLGR